MDDLLTDQQQAERVKSWIGENWIFLVAGVVLGAAALFGWNQWQRYQVRQAEAASALYETLMQAARANRLEEAEKELTILSAEHGSSPYVDQGRLALARLYVDRSNLEQAVKFLQQVANKAASPEIQNIARLRLARLLAFQEKYTEALKALPDPGSKAFAPAFHDIRGDIYYAMGKSAEARSEYEQALNGDTAPNVIDRVYVQAKLDELGGAAAALAGDPTLPAVSAVPAVPAAVPAAAPPE